MATEPKTLNDMSVDMLKDAVTRLDQTLAEEAKTDQALTKGQLGEYVRHGKAA